MPALRSVASATWQALLKRGWAVDPLPSSTVGALPGKHSAFNIPRLWNINRPNSEERDAIWRIQIAKYKSDAGKFDVGALARASEGLTGAVILQAFIDALYQAFAEGKEPSTLTCSLVLGELVPLSRLMGEQLKALREGARGRAGWRQAGVRRVRNATGSLREAYSDPAWHVAGAVWVSVRLGEHRGLFFSHNAWRAYSYSSPGCAG
jgi:hypothetical protein